MNIHWKDWCWSSNTLATWCKELTHLKRPWCCERLKTGGEGDDRGWGGWMASSTRWTWVWASSGSWWWTGCFSLWGPKESETTERLNWTARGNQLRDGSAFKAGGLWVSLLDLFLSSCWLLSLLWRVVAVGTGEDVDGIRGGVQEELGKRRQKRTGVSSLRGWPNLTLEQL